MSSGEAAQGSQQRDQGYEEDKRTLEPRVSVQQVGHRDASHSTPVLKRSPLICPLPRSAPCQVRGFTT